MCVRKSLGNTEKYKKKKETPQSHPPPKKTITKTL